jgi:pyruvate dehydrogenase E2 component (dihydrolipoamide acetyltransferase)
MSVELKLPLLADSMTTGRLGAWLKREGDAVKAGEPIVEVETDKTSVEIEAPVSGILERIVVKAGADGVPVGTVLGTIAEAGAGAHAAAVPPRVDPPVAPPSPSRPAPATPPPPPARVEPRAAKADPPRAAASASVDATPVARKMAHLAGLELGSIHAADGRRITKADVEATLGRRPAAAGPAVAPLPAAAPDLSAIPSAFEDRPLSAMRRITAARLQQAKQTVPHFYLQSDCRVDALVAMREQWNGRKGAQKISLTDLLVFAAARALQKVPHANSAFTGSALRVFSSVDIAVAVSTPTGLLTPVVRAAHKKSVLAISAELAELASRARSGGLTPQEYSGGTFTLSNLGMYGVTSILPILNPPSACIMGVGAVEARPVVVGSQVVPGRTMSITLAADHRALDGATGAELLAEVRRLVEDPLALALES